MLSVQLHFRNGEIEAGTRHQEVEQFAAVHRGEQWQNQYLSTYFKYLIPWFFVCFILFYFLFSGKPGDL